MGLEPANNVNKKINLFNEYSHHLNALLSLLFFGQVTEEMF